MQWIKYWQVIRLILSDERFLALLEFILEQLKPTEDDGGRIVFSNPGGISENDVRAACKWACDELDQFGKNQSSEGPAEMQGIGDLVRDFIAWAIANPESFKEWVDWIRTIFAAKRLVGQIAHSSIK